MIIEPNSIYHAYNQGNNRQRIFFNNEDYHIFLALYKKLFAEMVSTLAWCIMPNHFHFMFATKSSRLEKIKQGGIYINPIANGFRKLLSSYSRIHNTRNRKSGSLFRQKTKAKCLNDLPV